MPARLTTLKAVKDALRDLILKGFEKEIALNEVLSLMSVNLRTKLAREAVSDKLLLWGAEWQQEIEEVVGKQPTTGSDDWYAPPELTYHYPEVCGGLPELDPSGTETSNSKVHAARYYTIKMDGLRQPWNAKRLWVAPPYSLLEEFTDRLAVWIQDNPDGHAMLLAPWTAAKWFYRMAQLSCYVCQLQPNPRFWRPDTNITGCPKGMPHVLMYFGVNGEKFKEVYESFGVIHDGANWREDARRKAERERWRAQQEEENRRIREEYEAADRERRAKEAAEAAKRDDDYAVISQRVVTEEFFQLLNQEPITALLEIQDFAERNDYSGRLKNFPGAREFARWHGVEWKPYGTPDGTDSLRDRIFRATKEVESYNTERKKSINQRTTHCVMPLTGKKKGQSCGRETLSPDNLCVQFHGGVVPSDIPHQLKLEGYSPGFYGCQDLAEAYWPGDFRAWLWEESHREYTREHWREGAREEFRTRVFILSDGLSVSGGNATVIQLEMIISQAVELTVECQYAIEDIRAAGVSTLNEARKEWDSITE